MLFNIHFLKGRGIGLLVLGIVGLFNQAYAGQSLRLTGSQTASNSSVPAQAANAAQRAEFSLTFPSSHASGTIATISAMGIVMSYSGSNLQITPSRPIWSCCFDIGLTSYTSNKLKGRIQIVPSGAGGMIIWELWDTNDVRRYVKTQLYIATSGSNSNGVTLGSITGQDHVWDYFRLYTTTVPLGTRAPRTADVGDLIDWKFDNSLADTNGTYLATSSGGTPANPCGSGPCYETTAGQPLVIPIIETVAAANRKVSQAETLTQAAVSWRSNGGTAIADACLSYSQSDSGGTMTYSWDFADGPNTPTITSPTSCQTTITGLVQTVGTGKDYQLRVTVGDGVTTGITAIIHVGAVPTDNNGVVTYSDPNVDNILHKQIAFGQNPWGWEDETELRALNLRWAAYNVQDPYNTGTLANPIWDTTLDSGATVTWYWEGKGLDIGTACTTTTGTVLDTDTTIPVSNASCLDLSTFPTRITLQTVRSSRDQEEINICSATATSGAATLTICYDGRGKGNAGGLPVSNNNIKGPTTWSSGAVVGQFQFKGTSTNFLTTIAPGGAGCPGGPVTYSTGTAGLTAGSAAMTAGGGASWSGNVSVGDAVCVSAAHGSTSFKFVAYVSTVSGSLTLNRNFPSDADTATGLTFKVIKPWYRFIVLHFTRPSPYAGTSNVDFGTTGCEDDLRCFGAAYWAHDTSSMNNTGPYTTTYSFRDNTGSYMNQGSVGGVNFYGEDYAWWRLYYRSGLQLAKDAAVAISTHWVRYPPSQGLGPFGSPLFSGGAIYGATAGYLLNNTPSSDDMHPWWNSTGAASFSCDHNDSRDDGYQKGWLVLGARYSDTGSYPPGGTWQEHYRSFMVTLDATEDSCANANGGVDTNSWASAGSRLNGSSPAITFTNGVATASGTGLTSGLCDGLDVITVTVTNGQAAVTATSGTFSASSNVIVIGGRMFAFSRTDSTHGNMAALWPGSSGSASGITRNMDINGTLIQTVYANATTDESTKHNYSCIFNNSTQITLDRPWESTGGAFQSHSYYINGHGQQPYMLVIRENLDIQGAPLDAALGTTFGTKNVNAATWIATYGINPETKGANYGRVFGFCESGGTPTGSFRWTTQTCIPGFDLNGIVPERQLNSELMPALVQWYLANPTPANKATVDSYYGALWCNSQMNDASIASTCDAYAVGDNQAQSNLGDAYLGAGKYPGQMFGMGRASEWPAVRLGIVSRPNVSGSTVITGQIR